MRNIPPLSKIWQVRVGPHLDGLVSSTAKGLKVPPSTVVRACVSAVLEGRERKGAALLAKMMREVAKKNTERQRERGKGR